MLEKLSENEKKVITELLLDASTSNVEISKKTKLTPPAIGKIRKKLENNGLINYTLSLDMKKIGLNVLAIVFVKFTDEGWNHKKGMGITAVLMSTSNIVNIYRIAESEISHILTCVFRNMDELDRYFHVFQSRFSKYLEIKKLFTFSNDSILKQSSNDLMLKIINEFGNERMPSLAPITELLAEEGTGQ